ncbi:MAG: S41 family peptidase, partial [SAR324 cluster bacterium]|nr:S41 family peptidase [SAR324 cluster bacterium]
GTETSQSSQEERASASEAGETDKVKNKSAAQPSRTPQLRIDLEGIRERIVEFPVPEGLYEQILGLPNKVLFTETPLLEAIHGEGSETEDNNQGVLWVYDFEKQEKEVIAHEVDQVEVNPAGKTMLYFSGNQIRILEAGVPVPDESESDGSPSRKSGWLDLSRVRIAINYQDEWSQMFREAWRLQKEFFWNEQLSGVDWNAVYRRYENLLSRIGSRSELSDLIWEMQGELGTSHAYEYGGDYPFSPQYPVGQLGADLEYEPSRKAWVFRKIYRGDIWRVHQHSPLAEPGQQVQENDLLLEIGGVPLDGSTSPGELLVHQAGQAVQLTVKTPGKKESKRKIIVKTLIHEGKTRYREWVKQNLKFVEAQSEGRVGYLHIPDMDTEGIAEFHRGFLSQVDREGLIIDARFNAGGWVSPLVLEKLTHRHLGYDVPRWGSPESYPYHTLRGHLVLITNQFTGSDGDMFTASFKQLKLGKVIGKRTWGGVVGIDGRYQLVDGTTTTQPQYSIWFHHAGWSVENYGVDPDLVVEDPPQSYSNGMDHQLKRAVEVIQKILEEDPLPKIQDFKSNSR